MLKFKTVFKNVCNIHKSAVILNSSILKPGATAQEPRASPPTSLLMQRKQEGKGLKPTHDVTDNSPPRMRSDGWDDSYMTEFDVILPKTKIETKPDPLVSELMKANSYDGTFAKSDHIPDINGFNYWIEHADFDSLDYIVKRMVIEEIKPNQTTFNLLALQIRKSRKDLKLVVDLCSKFSATPPAEFYLALVNSRVIQQINALGQISQEKRVDRKVLSSLKFNQNYADDWISDKQLVGFVNEYAEAPKQLIVVYNMLLAAYANAFPAYYKVNSEQYMLKNGPHIAKFQDLIKKLNLSSAVPNLATLELAAINSLNLLDLEHCSKIINILENKKLQYNPDILCGQFVAYMLINEFENANQVLEKISQLDITPPENALVRQLLACLVYNIPTTNIDKLHKKYDLTTKLNSVLKRKLLVNDNLIAYGLFNWMYENGYKISPNAHHVLTLRSEGTFITIPPRNAE
ncbi:hypothetical protein HDV01_002492 [Terramyces sp. JEL0728]|nr:hypothetical protein HDV01_002492 [Terramyces sp. JEL0728]